MDHAPPAITQLITIPKSCEDAELWATLVQKLKSFRLESLQKSPEAFASTYEREIAFSTAQWEARLSNPLATTIVAIRKYHEDDSDEEVTNVQQLEEEEWLATTVLVQSESPVAGVHTSMESDHSHTPQAIEFHLNGVYVAPAHRNIGLGRAILQKALQVGQDLARSAGALEAYFKVRVDSDNLAACRTYARGGFQEEAREQLVMPEKMKDGIALPAREATILVMAFRLAVPN